MYLALFILYTFAFPLTSVFSSPTTSSKCTQGQAGFLSTHELVDNKGHLAGFKYFAFNYKDELSFFHQTPHPKIYVQFQECTPNWAGSNNSLFTKWGRIYVPQYKQCLAVTNPNGKEPYKVKRVPCLNSATGEMTTAKSIPQNWVLDTRGFTSWSGKTKENLSLVQGDGTCHPGAYIYLGDSHNEPVTNKAGDYEVQLVCAWEEEASAFFLNPT